MVGGALAGIMLGPWLGEIVMFLVLLIQCLLFHDGSITTLGANVVNMGIVGVVVGYILFKALATRGNRKRPYILAGAFLGGWLSVAIAGITCGLEIGYSPAFPYGIAITVPVMGGWHAALGIIEGVLTALIVDYIIRKSPSSVLSLR